jgi:hypothetical protein
MAVNTNPFADASKLAARFATGGMDTPREDFDVFEMSDGKLTYSLAGDDYVYEVADFDSENPTITIVESPRSGKRRIPVDRKANPGAYDAIPVKQSPLVKQNCRKTWLRLRKTALVVERADSSKTNSVPVKLTHAVLRRQRLTPSAHLCVCFGRGTSLWSAITKKSIASTTEPPSSALCVVYAIRPAVRWA